MQHLHVENVHNFTFDSLQLLKHLVVAIHSIFEQNAESASAGLPILLKKLVNHLKFRLQTFTRAEQLASHIPISRGWEELSNVL